jgi:FkbM family methyltransferase
MWQPKPEYIYRPRQLLRRIARTWAGAGAPRSVRLPWGARIEVDPRETVAQGIVDLGVHDLAVCESAHRLADPGELAVDAGANVGQMTSLLAWRVAPRGQVIAFEAHPEIAERLRDAAGGWRRELGDVEIGIRALALSSQRGTVHLEMPPGFSTNRGLARIAGSTALGSSIAVACTTLDDELGERRVGVMKLDVEGHEREVLRGAERALRERRIRDVVFEDHEPDGSPVVDHLRQTGMTVFGVGVHLRGPRLGASSTAGAGRSWQAPALIATFDPGRAVARFSARGWRVLMRAGD